jgi:hypothetical protein
MPAPTSFRPTEVEPIKGLISITTRRGPSMTSSCGRRGAGESNLDGLRFISATHYRLSPLSELLLGHWVSLNPPMKTRQRNGVGLLLTNIAIFWLGTRLYQSLIPGNNMYSDSECFYVHVGEAGTSGACRRCLRSTVLRRRRRSAGGQFGPFPVCPVFQNPTPCVLPIKALKANLPEFIAFFTLSEVISYFL